MKLSLSTSHGEIVLDLIDNRFTRKWLDHWCWMYEHFPTRSLYHPYPGFMDVNNMTPGQQQLMDADIQMLSTSVQVLKDIGTGFPYTVDVAALRAGREAGQQVLNVMHRAFTNSFRCDSFGLSYSWYSDNRDPFTVAPENKKLFLDNSANINTTVHNLEMYMISDHKRLASSTPCSRFSLYFDAYNVSEDSKILSRDAALIIQPEDAEFYSDSTEYDVWVGKDILGKDYMTAFLENDDPGEWDVTEILYYTGRIEIDLKPYTFVNRIRSPEFTQWLSNYGMEYTPRMAGIPLGNIVQGRDLLQTILADNNQDIPVIKGFQINE
jgi:hypothetical protein